MQSHGVGWAGEQRDQEADLARGQAHLTREQHACRGSHLCRCTVHAAAEPSCTEYIPTAAFKTSGCTGHIRSAAQALGLQWSRLAGVWRTPGSQASMDISTWPQGGPMPHGGPPLPAAAKAIKASLSVCTPLCPCPAPPCLQDLLLHLDGSLQVAVHTTGYPQPARFNRARDGNRYGYPLW